MSRQNSSPSPSTSSDIATGQENKYLYCAYHECTRPSWEDHIRDEHYCIFHTPRAEAKRKDFEAAWKNLLASTRNPDGEYQDLDCTGFVFPVKLDFHGARFSGRTVFNDTLFLDFADFYEVEFCDYIEFNDATFTANSDFSYVRFPEYAGFLRAVFSGNTHFYNARFGGVGDFREARFKSRVNFAYVRFEKIGIFDNADFIGADLSYSSFGNCRFEHVRYAMQPMYINGIIFPPERWKVWRWRPRRRVQATNFTGIETRDILTATNRQFVRDIEDQQYINQVRETSPVWQFIWRITSDYGRNFWLFLLWCMGVISLFALIYRIAGSHWFSDTEQWTPITPLYYSLVTFSTLGFGDIHPRLDAGWGQFTVMIEVILGYLGLGGLLSIFSNKLARRA